jgi:preprotein translocase subunit YajC
MRNDLLGGGSIDEQKPGVTDVRRSGCKQGLADYIPAQTRAEPSDTRASQAFPSQPKEGLMLISPAYAQSVPGGSDFLIQLMPILLMFVIFYLLLLRPQQQRVKAHREMVANLRRGDTVVTSGGIVGKVTKVKDDGEIEVEIAPNTRVLIVKGTVAEVRVKGEPVKESA